jgi:aminobenzoyl-glutamate transport protein
VSAPDAVSAAPPAAPPAAPGPESWLSRLERWGNRGPDPATMFALAWVGVVVLSWWGARQGWAVPDPRVASGDAPPVVVRDLLAGDDLTWLLTSAVRNWLDFPPLGLVLVTVLGVGVAEHSGLLAAAMRAAVVALPARGLGAGLVAAGVMSSVAGDAGYVVLPPLAAGLYRQVGRSPVAGIAAVTFGIAGGFSANLVPTSLDPLLAGLTESAARVLDPSATVSPTCNWAFMAASTAVLTAVGALVTAWVVEPRLPGAASGADVSPLRAEEKRGLGGAALVAAGVLGAWAASVGVDGAPLSGTWDKGGGRVVAAWTEALVPMLFVLFAAPGVAYGAVVGTIRSDRDVAGAMGRAMSAMGGYLALSFFAGQLVACFSRSQLALVGAVTAGDALVSWGWGTSALLVGVVALTATINLGMVSASAKWSFLAPILVPTLGRVGIGAATTQAAFRVGDSLTNPVAPLNPYLMSILVELRKHDPEAGLGTLLGLMLPYVLVSGVVWPAMLVVWVAAGLPLGV